MKVINILTLIIMFLPIAGMLGGFLKLMIGIPIKILMSVAWIAFILFARTAIGNLFAGNASSGNKNNRLDV